MAENGQLRLRVWKADPEPGAEEVYVASGWHSAQEFVEALRGLCDRTTCPVFVRWTCWHWVPEAGGGLRRYDVAPGGRGTRKVTLVAFGLTRQIDGLGQGAGRKALSTA